MSSTKHSKDHFDRLDAAIIDAASSGKPMSLDDIASKVMQNTDYTRPVIRDRTVTLALNNRFTRQGKGNNIKYKLTRDVLMRLKQVQEKPTAMSMALSAIANQIQTKTEEEETKPSPILLSDGIEIGIWKIMSDHVPYTPAEVALLLADYGFKNSSVIRTIGALHSNKGWFTRTQVKCNNRQTFEYTMKDNIECPKVGAKPVTTHHEPAKIPMDGIVAKVMPGSGQQSLLTPEDAIDAIHQQAEDLMKEGNDALTTPTAEVADKPQKIVLHGISGTHGPATTGAMTAGAVKELLAQAEANPHEPITMQDIANKLGNEAAGGIVTSVLQNDGVIKPVVRAGHMSQPYAHDFRGNAVQYGVGNAFMEKHPNSDFMGDSNGKTSSVRVMGETETRELLRPTQVKNSIELNAVVCGIELPLFDMMYLYKELITMGYGDVQVIQSAMIQRSSVIKGVVFTDNELYALVKEMAVELQSVSAYLQNTLGFNTNLHA